MALSNQDELILLRKRARRRLVGAVVLVGISTVVLWNVVGHLPDQPMKPETVEIQSDASAASASKTATASAPAASAAAGQTKMASPPPAVVEAAPVVNKAETTQLPADLSTIAAPAAAVAPSAVVAKPVAPAHNVPENKPVEKLKAPSTVSKPADKPQADKPQKEISPKKAESKLDKSSTKLSDKADSHAASKAESKLHKAVDPAAILNGQDSDAVAKPERKKSQDKQDKADASPSGKSMIQLAALSDPDKADALKSKLAGIGVSARFSKVQTSKGEVTRVRVGPFASRAEAEATLQKLSRAGVSGIIVSK